MQRLSPLGAACAAFLLFAAGSAPALAQPVWREATTPHFVIYTDGAEPALRDYAAKLEALDAAFWLTWGLQRPAGPVRRLPIYLVDDTDTFFRVRPTLVKGTAGFYTAGPNITFAMGLSNRKEDEIVLHEYAHHLMLQHFPGSYPAWLVEGYAAYFQGTDVDAKVVQVGRANALAGALIYAKWIKMEDLLSKRPVEFSRDDRGRFYAQSWLLTHYLLSDPQRARQLEAYLAAVAAGKPSAKALEDAIGMSLDALEDRLVRYAARPLSMVQFQRAQLPAVTVEVRRLPPAQAALLIDDLAVKSLGVGKAQGAATLARVRAAAQPYPDDPFAQRILARAEHYFGDRDTAETLIKRRIAADPRDTEALAIYADLLMDKGNDAPAQAEALYNQASNLLAASFRIDPNNYATLADFARSKRFEPGYPSDNTVTAELTAVKLAPQVPDNRILAAESLIRRKRYREARLLLSPILNDPHGGESSKALKDLLAQLPADGS